MLRFLPDPERATLVTAEVVSSAPRRSDWPCLENEKILVELLRSSCIPTGTARLLPEFFLFQKKFFFSLSQWIVWRLCTSLFHALPVVTIRCNAMQTLDTWVRAFWQMREACRARCHHRTRGGTGLTISDFSQVTRHVVRR